MSKDTEKILVSHDLENGLKVKIIDHCRLVAGDRWYLKISCIVEGDFPATEWQPLLTQDQQEHFLEKFPNGKVVFQYHKERNFIDDAIKEEALQEMVTQIEESNLGYMSKNSFASNLLVKTVEEFIQEYTVRKEMGLLDVDEEVEEPDDFSACFK